MKGEGTLYYPNGKIYKGTWDQLNGSGTIYYPSKHPCK